MAGHVRQIAFASATSWVRSSPPAQTSLAGRRVDHDMQLAFISVLVGDVQADADTQPRATRKEHLDRVRLRCRCSTSLLKERVLVSSGIGPSRSGM